MELDTGYCDTVIEFNYCTLAYSLALVDLSTSCVPTCRIICF